MGEKKNLQGTITAFNTYHTDAYAIAVKNGFEGTEAEWLESLKGDKGVDGKDGYTPVRGTDYWTEDDVSAMQEDAHNTINTQFSEIAPVIILHGTDNTCTHTSNEIYDLAMEDRQVWLAWRYSWFLPLTEAQSDKAYFERTMVNEDGDTVLVTFTIDSDGNLTRTDTILATVATAVPRVSSVTLISSAWEGADSLYSQVVTLDDITAFSKVDLLPSVEQLAIFFNKNVSFVTENEDGVVTVYAIGDKPTQDYTMQVQITEVTA